MPLKNIDISLEKTQKTYDVIIIGAGISGLSAAVELNKNKQQILVLEARDRIGGRIWSINPWGCTLDLGASWIHGVKHNPLSQLVHQHAIKTIPTSYRSDEYERKLNDMVLYDSSGQKISDDEIQATIPLVTRFFHAIHSEHDSNTLSLRDKLEQFIKLEKIAGKRLKIFNYFIVSSCVYEYAADLDKISSNPQQSCENSLVSGQQVIFPGGYIQLIGLLARNLPIVLNQEVHTIDYRHDSVIVYTQNSMYHARKLIITVPISLLKWKKISFKPPLPPEKIKALAKVKMGTFDKIYLYFDHVFWDEKKEWIGFLQSDPEQYPVFDIMNYYKFTQQPILLFFTAGKQAKRFDYHSDERIISDIMQELRMMYGQHIPNPSSHFITRWYSDPYALGSYSYLAAKSPANYYEQLAAPIGNTLFFAGEASSETDPATVHGAYSTGIRAAKEVLT
jgi:monoamine oxidase